MAPVREAQHTVDVDATVLVPALVTGRGSIKSVCPYQSGAADAVPGL